MSNTDSKQILEARRLYQEGWLDKLQLALDVIGFEPTVGTAADASNAVISALRAGSAAARGKGDLAKQHTIDAGISAISMVPFGDVVKIFKLRKARRVAMKGARAAKAQGKRTQAERRRESGRKLLGQEQEWHHPMTPPPRRRKQKPTPEEIRKAEDRAQSLANLAKKSRQQMSVTKKFGSDFKSKRINSSKLPTFKEFFEEDTLSIRDEEEWKYLHRAWREALEDWPVDKIPSYNKHLFQNLKKEEPNYVVRGPKTEIRFFRAQKLSIATGQASGQSFVTTLEVDIDGKLTAYIITGADIDLIEGWWQDKLEVDKI
jgi:hypothetical protein